jgi:hypothetical protein
MDEDLSSVAGADVKAIEPLLEDIEGGVGRVDLDALLPLEGRHAEVGQTGPDVDPDRTVAPPGKGRELGLARHAEPEEVAPPELDLGLAVRGHELIALRDGEIHLGGLLPEVRAPVNGDFAPDIAQPGVALVIGLVRLGGGHERSQRHDGRKNRSEHQGFSHLLSPRAYMKSKNRAINSPHILPCGIVKGADTCPDSRTKRGQVSIFNFSAPRKLEN